MIEVVQAFDRSPIAQLESDDSAALERKIETARGLFADRHAWLKLDDARNDRAEDDRVPSLGILN